MIYRLDAVAKAFVRALDEHRGKDDIVVKNFAKFLREKRLIKNAGKIIEIVERLLLEKKGGRKIMVETAVPLTRGMRDNLKKDFRKEDSIRERVNPARIAGVRITIDDNLVIDGTMERKLKRLFRFKS